MKIKTDQPIMIDRNKITRKIAKFWDQISEGWREIWGDHIHHGFYESNKILSPNEAQEILIIKLAQLINIPNGAHILDAGCGMGGSSLYLSKNFAAHVTGITLSQKQVSIAKAQAIKLNDHNTTFKVEDALSLPSFLDNSVDIVWSLESCEQFYDKALFIEQAFRVLKPGGKLMLATWCSDQAEYEDLEALQYQKLCMAFDLPYMPTMEHYCNILTLKNFRISNTFDWTNYVRKSWDVGLSLVNTFNFFKLIKMGGLRGLRFARQIKLMHHAFEQNKIRYGVFIATKPS